MRPTSWILTVFLWLYGEVVWEQSVLKITASAYVFSLQLMNFEFRHNDQFCVTNENLTQTQ